MSRRCLSEHNGLPQSESMRSASVLDQPRQRLSRVQKQASEQNCVHPATVDVSVGDVGCNRGGSQQVLPGNAALCSIATSKQQGNNERRDVQLYRSQVAP
ncbi:MAG TPA: hypothetical protein DDX19_07930 [Rhodopirellula baltica]|nr:hypothetical protein [Rhodopirellula baltica]